MKIGVLCSGGDAPGMNPCLRAIVRAGEKYGDRVIGIRHGYTGLLTEEFWGGDGSHKINARDVSGLTNKGGAFLNCSRCKEMTTEEGLQKAVAILRKHSFDALLTIGGNGTLSGARDIAERWDGLVVGLPGTIDNDLLGTDATIGFATAVQTGVEAIDKLRDTAGSHDMMFLVEVMGRHCGDLATHIALASGCELVAVPEVKTQITHYVKRLEHFRALGKRSIIMVVAEGDDFGGAIDIMKALKEAKAPYEMRAVVLGHVQRGGVPAPADRILATKLGCFAIDALHNGVSSHMVGEIGGVLTLTPLKEVVGEHREQSEDAVALIDRLSV
ncbi:MAG: ATP-dependent 6-phosphofructokinase [Planctomycetia bacterium]|nr:ATP-dependent 6-phosphofructokinase [Planctomycetia bacterium]